MKKILLGQLGSYGDCLYATAVARQIKADNPGCHLTWAIGSKYRNILNNNPHVNAIWEYPISTQEELSSKWEQFEAEAHARYKSGEFDEIYLTQVFPDNLRNFDGTLRSSIFRAYPHPITVSVEPDVYLSGEEIEHVKDFVEKHNIEDYQDVILFECSPGSGQSFITTEFALSVAQRVLDQEVNVCVILSTHESIDTQSKDIIVANSLTFRENAELSKYCTLLVGCSSGISWLCTSDSANHLPMIQVLSRNTYMAASFIHDHEYFHLPTGAIVELSDCYEVKLSCIILLAMKDIHFAKDVFGERVEINLTLYFWTVVKWAIKTGRYFDAFHSFKIALERWGFHPHPLRFLTTTAGIFYRRMKP